ncbi:MAG: phosphatidylcholine/phosphatidylserine synthase [Sphingomonadaceae bacterium]|jgi:CDP-diacylglycerol--serine O-phosphatidyltransferase|nr:phosphatidylcholine/phosphatidylserine synthase [Sphingomonadaceae bacterium]NCA01870.1 phosphatidylcholine/phosphatidylserine synthase [Sphingomonadaceae bacterium]
MTPAKRGISLRAVAPNAVTALALCFGLTAIRFAISAVSANPHPSDWERAIGAIVIAGVLDGLDGRIARLLKGESRFGAELDSLSDVIAFGVSPALIMYLWSLQHMPRFGWICALAFAVCCALRLARFNAAIDAEDQPHKSAGFLTGVPAPAGAGLAFVPLYLWIVTGDDLFRNPVLVAPWLVFVAALMTSNIATFSWGSIRLRRTVRLEAILVVALVGAALFSEPWITLTAICVVYLLMIPFSIRSYGKIRRARTP